MQLTTVGVVLVVTDVNCTLTTALAIVFVEVTGCLAKTVSFWPLGVKTNEEIPEELVRSWGFGWVLNKLPVVGPVMPIVEVFIVDVGVSRMCFPVDVWTSCANPAGTVIFSDGFSRFMFPWLVTFAVFMGIAATGSVNDYIKIFLD